MERVGSYPGQLGLTKQRVLVSPLGGSESKGMTLCFEEGEKCDLQSGKNWRKVSIELAVVYLVSRVRLCE